MATRRTGRRGHGALSDSLTLIADTACSLAPVSLGDGRTGRRATLVHLCRRQRARSGVRAPGVAEFVDNRDRAQTNLRPTHLLRAVGARACRVAGARGTTSPV